MHSGTQFMFCIILYDVNTIHVLYDFHAVHVYCIGLVSKMLSASLFFKRNVDVLCVYGCSDEIKNPFLLSLCGVMFRCFRVCDEN